METKEEELEHDIVVPDADDLGLKVDPLTIKVNTDAGKVRPVVVIAEMNRQGRRALQRKLKEMGVDAEIKPAPIQLRPRLSDMETTDRMADLLMKDYETSQYFPAKTLAQFLDNKADRIYFESWRRGMPLPDRDAVRRAIGKLWEETQRKNKTIN